MRHGVAMAVALVGALWSCPSKSEDRTLITIVGGRALGGIVAHNLRSPPIECTQSAGGSCADQALHRGPALGLGSTFELRKGGIGLELGVEWIYEQGTTQRQMLDEFVDETLSQRAFHAPFALKFIPSTKTVRPVLMIGVDFVWATRARAELDPPFVSRELAGITARSEPAVSARASQYMMLMCGAGAEIGDPLADQHWVLMLRWERNPSWNEDYIEHTARYYQQGTAYTSLDYRVGWKNEILLSAGIAWTL